MEFPGSIPDARAVAGGAVTRRVLRPSALAGLALFGLALIAAMWAAIVAQTRYEKQQVIANVVQQNSNLAIAFEQYVTRTLQSADAVARYVAHEYLRTGGPFQIARFLADQAIDPALFVAVSIADEHGDVIASSSSQLPHPMNIASEEQFSVHVRRDSGTIFVGKPVRMQRIERPMIVLTRRITRPDGSFGGIVALLLDPQRFTDFYRQATIRDHDVLSVTGLDGIVRSRRFGQVERAGEDLSGSQLLAKRALHPTGSFYGAAKLDGLPRFFSYRTLPDYPLVATVGMSEDDALYAFRSRRNRYYWSAGAASLLIVLFTALLMSSLARQRLVTGTLARREARLRATFNQSAIGIAHVGLDGRYFQVNRRFCEMLGYTKEELFALTVRDVTHPEDRRPERRMSERLMAAPDSTSVEREKRYLRKDGSVVWAVASAARISGDAWGNPAYFLVMVQDISERKRGEERLRRVERARTIVARCNHTLVHATSEAELLQNMCDTVVESQGYVLAWVGLVEHDPEQSIRPVAMRGVGEVDLRDVRMSWGENERGRGPSGRAVRSGRPCVASDIASHPNFELWREVTRKHRVGSVASLPLRHDERVFGVVSFGAPEPDGFDADEVALLEELSDDLAYGVLALRTRAEHALAQSRLRESEQRLRVTFDAAAIGIVHTSLDGRHLFVNRKFCEMLGYTPEELLALTIRDVVHEEDVDQSVHDREGLVAGERATYEAEQRCRCKDGSLLWVNRSVSIVRDAEGRPLQFIGALVDISQRKAAEEALRASEERYRHIVETAQEGIWLIDEQGCTSFANPKMEEMLGWTRGAMVGRPIYEFMDDKARQKAEAGLKRRSERIVEQEEVRFRRKDGSELWAVLATSPIEAPSGAFAGALAMVTEITERKRQDEKIARLSRIQKVLSGINSVIVRVRSRQELFEESCRIALEHGGFEMAWVGLLDRQTLEVRTAAHVGIEPEVLSHLKLSARADVPFGRGPTGRALRERKPTFNNDMQSQPHPGPLRALIAARGYHSTISLPLLEGGEPVGVLNLFARVPNFFDSEEVALLSELAADISFGLEHIAKEAKIAHLSRIRTLMSGINALTVRVHDRSQLFKEACRIAVEKGGFGMAWIGLLDPVTLEIAPVAWAGERAEEFAASKSTARADVPGGQGAVGRAIRERRPVFSNDILAEPGVGGRRRAKAAELGLRSLITLPLLVNGEAIGNFSLFATGLNFFNDEEVQLLTAMTDDISFALEFIDKEEKLNFLALYDTLTALPNRRLFLDRLSQALAQAKRDARLAGVMFIDLDRFKAINDSYGHGTGDQLLRLIGTRLRESVRSSDTVARLGGDEFAIVLSDLTGNDDASVVAQKLIAALARPFELHGRETYITMSIGIALYPVDGEHAEELLKNADTAMYRAKDQARNTYQFYLPRMNDRAAARLHLETELRGALRRQEFVLHFQPKIRMPDGRISGFEALLRWRHPERGLVWPNEFISTLEDTGMIVPVGEWVMRSVCEQILAWERAGLEPQPVAVNLSARQFQHERLDALIGSILGSSGIDPRLLEFELTESLLMSDAQEAARTLRSLKAYGVGLSVDDFGTGYSSLAYLKRFPLDVLKIDRAFIRDITTDADDAAITRAIITLAHSLKLKVVAEGVETREQAEFLQSLACDELQGYYFGEPRMPQEYEHELRPEAANARLRLA